MSRTEGQEHTHNIDSSDVDSYVIVLFSSNTAKPHSSNSLEGKIWALVLMV